jgi:hypothetical protein
MKNIAIGFVAAMVVYGLGYWSGLESAEMQDQKAQVEALATSLTKTAQAKVAHENANRVLTKHIHNLEMSWSIYEKDKLDSCLDAPVTDARLVWLLMDLPEGNPLRTSMAVEGIAQAKAGTPIGVTWGKVGKLVLDYKEAFRSCELDKATIADWCEEMGCVDSSMALSE